MKNRNVEHYINNLKEIVDEMDIENYSYISF